MFPGSQHRLFSALLEFNAPEEPLPWLPRLPQLVNLARAKAKSPNTK